MENEDEDKEKVCAFHLIVRGFFDLVCFAGIESRFSVRDRNLNKKEASFFEEYLNHNLKRSFSYQKF